MKDQMGNNKKSASSSMKTKQAHKVKGVKSVMIRKNSPEGLILRRIREYLLYTRLRSLIPPAQPSKIKGHKIGEEEATEIELECDEMPERDSDEESGNASEPTIRGSEEEECNEGCCSVVIESEEEGTKPFVPSVKIKNLDGSLLISTIVLKDLALTSDLFRILEEDEEIDIVFENHYRTESKVAHTIQVKVPQDYNVDLLEKKLCRWAGKPMY